MNKIILSRIPLVWADGQHKISQTTDEDSRAYTDTGLYLIHLRHFNLRDEAENPRDFGPFLHAPHQNVLEKYKEYKTPMPEWVKELI